ncbi:GNAT family N-acetyltransferase [Pseudomonas sp. ABC1]|uniref:GNAT family N-acetyltransferase n=1 Tax=Pseudomonas sp. ABC1 TaxID=2748080 RepID=UPI0015C39A0F|nr:GNAT family N-acetyltransferase [Pseudomonas sp. ABC1]QLF93231.1 GNAT family N-acetyltransferase [Pseudomonas sp. ABC1]
MIEITDIPPHQVAETLAFILQARAELFPKLHDRPIPADLEDFPRHYTPAQGGRFLVARDGTRIVACIGYLPYDRRFPNHPYPGLRVVEIVRLFVLPAYRRTGLAARLYQALEAHASTDQVQMLYLHTHPFLPGAIAFWERQGFRITEVEDDPAWRTTHMQRDLATRAIGIQTTLQMQ